MNTRPIPVTVALANGIELRGHEWSVDGPPVVFVHDLGDDLDAWDRVTSAIARSGFRVISLELRGHGLSDGEPDPSAVVEDMRLLLAEVASSFGPVGLVSYGAASEALFSLDDKDGAPVQVIISPRELDPEGVDWVTSRWAMRLIIGGTLDEQAQTYLKTIYPKILGEKLWVSVATTEAGPALLIDQPTALEQLTMFLRRYLTGYHLAWIKKHETEIRALAQSRNTDDDSESE